ncbi:MAG TPA: hypothetical protein VEI97_00200, partial [bacterium]|nr:hypothetical protein [bacterium]
MTRSSVSLFLALPLLALTGLACGGDDINDILAPPTFDYEPQFAEYTGGVGLSNSPLAGVWQIRINASSNGTVAAQTINVVPQVINDEHGDPKRVLGFTLAPNRAANIYLEGTLGDSTLDMKLYQYEPGTNTVTTYTMEGLLDLG